MQPLERAILLLNGATTLAAGLGVSPNLPHMWKARGNVPVQYRPGIELLAGGAVRAEEFGDDVAWLRVPDEGWPHEAGRPLADFAKPA